MTLINCLRCFCAGLIVATLALPSSLLGDAVCPPSPLPEESYRAIVALNAAGCLGTNLGLDQTPLARSAKKSIVAMAVLEEVFDRYPEVIAAVSVLLEAVKTLPVQDPGAVDIEHPSAEAIRRLEVLHRGLLGGTTVGTNPVQPDAWTYEVPGPEQSETRGIPVRDWLRAHCGQTQAPGCAEAFATAQTLVRTSNLVGVLLEKLRDPAPLLTDSRLRLARWRSYFGDARSQYPWELWLNDRWTLNKERPMDPVAGVPLGPRQVPDRQFIWMHPDVALEYMEDGSEGNQLEEAGYLELLGFNRWRWKDDAKSPMGRALGASLVVAYSDRSEQDDVGVGLIVHVNNRYSLAVLDHDGATSWLVSADLAKLWNKVPGAVRDRWIGGLLPEPD